MGWRGMGMEETINKQTLSEQIYSVLRNDILNLRIPCGSKLTLKALRERFNVSHTPIREALTRLSEDELVTYYSNVGVSVITLDRNDAREIFSLIGELDCLALRYALASENRDALAASLSENMRRSDESLGSGSMAVWRDLSDDFHRIFYNCCNNSRLEDAWRKLLAQMTLISNSYGLVERNAETINADHRAIFEAIVAGDDAEAERLMRLHLGEDLKRALESIKYR